MTPLRAALSSLRAPPNPQLLRSSSSSHSFRLPRVHSQTPRQKTCLRCSAQSGGPTDACPPAQPGAAVLSGFFAEAVAAAEAAAAESSAASSSSSSSGGGGGVALPAGGAVDRKAVLHEALKQLSEEDLESASQKYNLHEELFAELDFARINAFSPSPFGGNPAAVVYLPYMPTDEWLQLVATEFNLSETAYIVRRRTGPLKKDGDGLKAVTAGLGGNKGRGNEFDLRWFTPVCEVKLCGHATLASAHLLFTAGLLEADCDTAIFHTLSGALRARRVSEESSILAGSSASPPSSSSEGSASDSDSGAGGSVARRKAEAARKEKRRKGRGIIELSFPLLPVTPLEESDWGPIEKCLCLPTGSLLWAGRNSLGYILAEVGNWQTVVDTTPDMDAMLRLPIFGVMLTAPTLKGADLQEAGGDEPSPEISSADFVSRFFAPSTGVPEDPVTGSAHCSLGPFWAKRLGKTQVVGYQASERGGQVAVSVDEAAQRVTLQGWAVMVQAGVLLNTIGPGAQ